MTKEDMLQQIMDINTDAANYIYTGDKNALDSMVNSVYDTGLATEDEFINTLRLYRLTDMPFYMGGYNFIPEDLKNEIWGKYETIIKELVIHNISLNDFLNDYGYENEYDALNAQGNERKIYNNTIIKRIKLINEYTKRYSELKALYDTAAIRKIHQGTDKATLQNRFTRAIVDLVNAREKFYYYINWELVGDDAQKLNQKLEQEKNNKKRIALLKNTTDNIFTTLQNNSSVDFRDFFIIKDNRRVKFTNYLTAQGFSSNSWFNYKRKDNKKFVEKRHFYLQMASFLGLPDSHEIEKFLNFNGYTIKSPFRMFPNSSLYDYDVCRYIDAGISFDLINTMLQCI